MASTANLEQIMFKAKVKIKKSDYVEMEIELEASRTFLLNFYSKITEEFSILENSKG